MKAYKIRNKITGLYADGGIYAPFSKNGKLWTNKSNLDRHLKMVFKHDRFNDDVYKDCEIIEYDVVISKVTSFENYEM